MSKKNATERQATTLLKEITDLFEEEVPQEAFIFLGFRGAKNTGNLKIAVHGTLAEISCMVLGAMHEHDIIAEAILFSCDAYRNKMNFIGIED